MFEIKTYKEAQCQGMCESVLAYYGSRDDRYLKKYEEELGAEKVNEIFYYVKAGMKRINRDVHTDCEGLSYNSVDYEPWYVKADENRVRYASSR